MNGTVNVYTRTFQAFGFFRKFLGELDDAKVL